MSIAIIPARGGSKRIKNKNLRNFFGKPLISYSILAAKKSKLFKRIIVSTDDKKIKKISEKYGAEVPFLRPKNISGDKTKAQDVFIHAIRYLERKKVKFNYVCGIYPTAPLLQIKDLIQGFKKVKKWNYVFSACKHEKSVIRSFILNKNKKINFIKPNFINKNTQELPDSFYDAGQFYWADKKSWLNQNMYLLKGSLVEIDKKFVQDVDYINDLKILKKKFKKIKKI
tara:strand:- start:21664 stop:22344 length:681 start_codon:yes stop_codon:yes gene_type:complete